MMTKRMGLAAAAVAVLVVAAPGVADQDGIVALRSAAMAPPTNPDKAAQLKKDAESLFSQPQQWKKAVRMLEESAELRDANDPEAYECLLYAGRISVAIGDLDGARGSLEKAAAQALARGAIVEAAHAYIDAAHTAVAQKDAGGARELMTRASLLSESPLLSVSQRSSLRIRLNA